MRAPDRCGCGRDCASDAEHNVRVDWFWAWFNIGRAYAEDWLIASMTGQQYELYNRLLPGLEAPPMLSRIDSL